MDLFGSYQLQKKNEIKPTFLKNQKFSNPLKNIYYNYILKENLNSLASVEKLLKKYSQNVELIVGDTNEKLREVDLKNIDFTFLDGGHSYQTVISDLSILYENMKGRNKVVLCDDYGEASFILEVKNAIDDFSIKNNIKVKLIENRFAELIF